MSTAAPQPGAIREKVEAGQRLSFDDGLALEATNDLFALGSMANLVRERYNGNFGYYNVNTHINPTNVCVYTCDFCAFRADLDEPKAYVMDRDQIVERARQASARGATELHIVGGLHHKLPFEYYVDVVRWIKETRPRSTSRRTPRSRSSSSRRSPGSRPRRSSTAHTAKRPRSIRGAEPEWRDAVMGTPRFGSAGCRSPVRADRLPACAARLSPAGRSHSAGP